MQIERIEVYNPSIDLKSPFVTSLRSISQLQPVIVRVETDAGLFGWGEAPTSPPILGETAGTVLGAFDYFLPHLLGRDPRALEEIVSFMDQAMKNNTAAKAAIDIALHDLLGNLWEEPVWRILGGFGEETVTTDFTVSIGEPDVMAGKARDLVESGFRTLKIKVGDDLEKDIEKLEKIREAVGPEINLRIDANQGWNRKEALQALRKVEKFDVQFAEQPLKDSDIEGMALLREKSPIPVMADESVHGPEEALEIVKRNAADYINIKLSKSGGFLKAKKIAAISETARIENMVGGMAATDILGTAAVHLAGALENVKFRDLDMGSSIVEPVILDGGSELKGNLRTLPETSGLGIERINEELLGEAVRVFE